MFATRKIRKMIGSIEPVGVRDYQSSLSICHRHFLFSSHVFHLSVLQAMKYDENSNFRCQNVYFCGIRCPGDVFVLSPPREFLPSTAMLSVVQAKTNSPDLSHKCLAIVKCCKLM